MKKVDTSILMREPLVVASPNDLRAKVAEKAKQLFGYGVLKDKMRLADELGKVLVKLEIEPFNREAVEVYKKSKVSPKKLISLGYRYQRFRTTDWKRIRIENYTRPIPEFALNKAVQIKEALPKVALFIDELTVTNQTQRERRAYRPDPFLVAALGDEDFYIEVWDEPIFEGRLEAPNVKPRKITRTKKQANK